MLPDAKLDAILARHAALEAELSGQLSPEAYVKASREFSELSPIIDSVKRYRALLNELADLDALLADPSTDPEMRAMAEAEKPELEARLDALGEFLAQNERKTK